MSDFRVHIPANIYDGKYYDFRTAPLLVEAESAGEAMRIVNRNKEKALRLLDEKKMLVGDRRIRYVANPAKDNVFFQLRYYTTETQVQGSRNTILKEW